MNDKQVNDHVNSIIEALNDYNKQNDQVIKDELREYILERFSDLELEFLAGKMDCLTVDQAKELDKVINWIEKEYNEQTGN
jgi:hypothetical protein